jgi:hypothetical protein
MYIGLYEGSDERLRYAVGLRAAVSGRKGRRTHNPRKFICFVGNMCVPDITEPLNSYQRSVHRSETGLDEPSLQISRHISGDAPCFGYIAHNLTIAAIDDESHPDSLPILAYKLEGIRTPAQIVPNHPDILFMHPHRLAPMQLQKKMVPPCDPVIHLWSCFVHSEENYENS